MRCWRNSNKRRKQMAMTSSRTATVTLPTDEQILITREFDAPKQLVYKAFTEADGRTTLIILVQATSKLSRDAIIDSGMEAGLQDAMNLLEQVALSLR